MRKLVFVSYSNKDSKFLEEFLTHLDQHLEPEQIDKWDEERIKTEADWKDSLRKALGKAFAAVLLVSPNYLSTDYILQHDLPALLKESANHGVIVRLVAVSESSFDLYDLAQFSNVNDPDHALIKLGPEKRKLVWTKLLSEFVEIDLSDHSDIPEIESIFFAIKSRHPQLTDSEVEKLYSQILDQVAKHIGGGDQLAFIRMKEDSNCRCDSNRFRKITIAYFSVSNHLTRLSASFANSNELLLMNNYSQ